MSPSKAERYLRLWLRLGRHRERIVDAYYGPPELAAAVDEEPLIDSRALVSEAKALRDELPDGWLRDQVVGLCSCARVLAGESGSYADEVEGCYGVRPLRTDEAVFSSAHERLEELLPGDGTLAERYWRWERSNLVPADQIERLLAAVIEEARAWTGRLVELPDGERVALEAVRGKPWWASCDYLGGLRFGRARALPRVRGRRADAVPPAAHEAGPRPRSARGERLKAPNTVRRRSVANGIGQDDCCLRSCVRARADTNVCSIRSQG